ncbi:MAG: penicillin-binding protein 2 [Planctomycetota bacterium]
MPAGNFEAYQRRVGSMLLVGVALVFLLLAGRLVHINTAMAARLRTVVQKQHTGSVPIPARRGSILDCRGRVVAATELMPSVFADPFLVENLPGSAVKVASALQMVPGEVEDIIRHSESPRFCWLKRRIPPGEAEAVRALRLPGFGTVDESVRRYPLGSVLAHVLGFVGTEGTGLAGLELQYDSRLRGCDGRMSSIRDVRRRAVWRLEDGTVGVTDGGHLALTIDTVIQGIVEEQLAERVKAFGAESGVALVMSPKTGDILAMACYPTFEPADYAAVPPEVWRNRVVADPIEPGSTFKPIIAGGALAAGRVTLTETIFCHNGAYETHGRVVRDTHPHGNLTLEGIIAKSSNIGMALIGQRMGNSALHEIMRQFGFGVPTGIGFPGESAGMVLPMREWTALSTTSIPMGYEVGVTPLQLVTAYGAIVNGGILLKPRLVRGVLAADGAPLETFDAPQPLRRVLPEKVARFLTETALVAVVETGGEKSEASDYPMLGKTGTAKLTRKGQRGYSSGAYLSSFVGAAPVDDPQILVLVSIRRPDPHKGYYGRTVSMPVARRIIDLTLAYLEVPPRPRNGPEAAARPATGDRKNAG